MTSSGDDRSRALARRLRAHGLDRRSAEDDVAVVGCGFQDAGEGTAPASLALRVGADALVDADDPAGAPLDRRWAVAMTLRGVPHLHRRADLPSLRAAMATTDRDDLEAVCGPLPDGVDDVEDTVGEVAAALQEAIGEGDRTKAELSRAGSAGLRPVLVPHCERCGTAHVIDGLFRLATLRAGLELVAGARTQTFRRWRDVTDDPGPEPPHPRTVAAARTRLVGAATASAAPWDRDQLAAWIGWHPRSVVAAMEGDGTPPPRSRSLRRHARLLPARDPWLRGSDRDLLLGRHADRRGDVFRSLGAPGVVLVDGEVVGTWRQRKAGRRLRVELDAWRRLTADDRDELDEDAAVVARARGLAPPDGIAG
ncbi:DNA glycosylase AlkZ-like family protein [Dermatobacter hominis]|uniref:DNA glycosylase AlkZ-like family protein n=1 Tax=Dermatobacter hominis TaxID=2884263 RepID=UPI001D111B86|nr:crosslink repair DNA glycosylase YcaQ family protein [Dermatobacter hominis]UDY36121.1 winged helix DNA-binding domain-containing protein [Dermatobacter hominis]